MKIEIVLSGRNYEIAHALPDAVELPEGATLDDLLEALARSLPDGKALPSSCLLAVAGAHLGTIASHPPKPLADGDEVVIVAPVAGG